MSRPFVILGNPENRRVTAFQAALLACGQSAARVLAWREIARDPSLIDSLPADCLLRIDSFGEDFEVEKLFLELGADAAACAPTRPRVLDVSEVRSLIEDRGRILAPRQMHLGFLRVLRELDARLSRRPDVRVLQPIAVIEELFDKSATWRRLAAAGVPVPESYAASELAELRASVDVDCVFVKLTCGSSASCLAIWTRAPRESIVTTIEMASTGWYNSLKLRRYTDRRHIDAVLTFLLREGAHIERAIDKARLNELHTDCRVLVVAGEPAFTVVRASRHPITNLHLGGQRADLAALALEPHVEHAAMETARAIGRIYPALHIGVDLMIEADRGGHRVLEANAFGDLLPGLVRDGRSVYEWEIRAALAS